MKVTINDIGDHVCEHGTAVDVHCCNCHNGFIFDLDHECPDEELAPHPFNSRTPYEPGDDRDIWCKDCEYHRGHQIHSADELAAVLQRLPLIEKTEDAARGDKGTLPVGLDLPQRATE